MSLKDVLIIGAGASGSAAAFHLASFGRKVALLEKNNDLIRKPCGGGMSAVVQEWFPFDLKPIVEEVIQKVEFTWCLNDPVVANLPGSAPFWIVRRETLDNFLAMKAIEAGAELIKPFQVTSLNKRNKTWLATSFDGQTIEAKSVIIADGSKSPWPKLYGLGPEKLHHASTISVRLKGRGNLKKNTARFEFGLTHHGFAWAFPLHEEVNVGVGTFIGKSKLNSKKVLSELLPALGFDPKEGDRKETSLRVWNGHSLLHKEGLAVVGDAASLCDPFLAEGLRPAIMSGCEAANSINSWLEGEVKDLSNYSKAMKLKWGNSMAWGKRISQVFYRFPKVGYQLGIKRPTAPERIAQILSGKMGYGDIAQRVIKRLIFQK